MSLSDPDISSLNRGSLTITVLDNIDITGYRACVSGAGCIDLSDLVIDQLEYLDYSLTIYNQYNCEVNYQISAENCENTEDDDGDGFVDCEDEDCKESIIVRIELKSHASCEENSGSIKVILPENINSENYSICIEDN